jgi:hypothetical protein
VLASTFLALLSLPIPIGIVPIEAASWAPIRIGIGIWSPIGVRLAIAGIIRSGPNFELFDGEGWVGIFRFVQIFFYGPGEFSN